MNTSAQHSSPATPPRESYAAWPVDRSSGLGWTCVGTCALVALLAVLSRTVHIARFPVVIKPAATVAGRTTVVVSPKSKTVPRLVIAERVYVAAPSCAVAVAGIVERLPQPNASEVRFGAGRSQAATIRLDSVACNLRGDGWIGVRETYLQLLLGSFVRR